MAGQTNGNIRSYLKGQSQLHVHTTKKKFTIREKLNSKKSLKIIGK